MAVTHAGRFERESSIEGLGADIAIGHLEVRDLRAITRGQAAADGLLDRHCRREAVGAGLAVQQDGDLIEAVFFVAGHGEEAIPLLKHDAIRILNQLVSEPIQVNPKVNVAATGKTFDFRPGELGQVGVTMVWHGLVVECGPRVLANRRLSSTTG